MDQSQIQKHRKLNQQKILDAPDNIPQESIVDLNQVNPEDLSKGSPKSQKDLSSQEFKHSDEEYHPEEAFEEDFDELVQSTTLFPNVGSIGVIDSLAADAPLTLLKNFDDKRPTTLGQKLKTVLLSDDFRRLGKMKRRIQPGDYGRSRSAKRPRKKEI
jgi:hypothetical protein